METQIKCNKCSYFSKTINNSFNYDGTCRRMKTVNSEPVYELTNAYAEDYEGYSKNDRAARYCSNGQ